MEKEKSKKFLTLLTIINIFLFLVTIGSCFYYFYIKKDFNITIEVPCDINKEQCIQRDCSNPDDCPLNGLSDFKRYTLNARDFQYCPDEDCSSLCENGGIECEKIECYLDEEMGEDCSMASDIIEVEDTLDNKENELLEETQI